MAYRRYRVVRTGDRYMVKDHGPPTGGVERIGKDQAGAGKLVPQYKDSDPLDIDSPSWIIWSSANNSVESKDEARRVANHMNEEWEAHPESPHGEVLSELNYKLSAELKQESA